MLRFALRGLLLTGLFGLGAVGVLAQPGNKDKVTVRGDKTAREGRLKVAEGGFAVFTGDKADKAGEAINPDDIVRVRIGDLAGVDRAKINQAETFEYPDKGEPTTKALTDAREVYKGLLKGPGLDERGKRYLEYKVAALNQRLTDDLEADKGWKEKADEAISEWNGFLQSYKAAPGWELWPAARSLTRLRAERGKFDEAADDWALLKGLKDLPAEARLEAALQELDFRIRAQKFGAAATAAKDADTLKLLEAVRKERAAQFRDRLAVYAAAANAGAAQYQQGIDAVKGLMDKTKDPAVHAAGFMVMGELYLAADKPRDAMWMFLWVETVVNQDPHEVFKAVARLTELFTPPEKKDAVEAKGGRKSVAEEETARKYREKLKRLRTAF